MIHLCLADLQKYGRNSIVNLNYQIPYTLKILSVSKNGTYSYKSIGKGNLNQTIKPPVGWMILLEVLAPLYNYGTYVLITLNIKVGNQTQKTSDIFKHKAI